MNIYLTRNIEGIAGRSDHRRTQDDAKAVRTLGLFAGILALVAVGAGLYGAGLL